jgi:hypothetical protein
MVISTVLRSTNTAEIFLVNYKDDLSDPALELSRTGAVKKMVTASFVFMRIAGSAEPQ